MLASLAWEEASRHRLLEAQEWPTVIKPSSSSFSSSSSSTGSSFIAPWRTPISQSSEETSSSEDWWHSKSSSLDDSLHGNLNGLSDIFIVDGREMVVQRAPGRIWKAMVIALWLHMAEVMVMRSCWKLEAFNSHAEFTAGRQNDLRAGGLNAYHSRLGVPYDGENATSLAPPHR